MTKSNLPILRKHVSAIHIGTKDFGLLHRKSVNAAIYLARDLIKKDFKGDIGGYLAETKGKEVMHKANLSEFKALINYNSNDNEHLKEVLRKLATTPVEFDILGSNSKEDTWSVMPLFSFASIKGSEISFRFPSEIREQLINPKVYAQISLAIQNKFRSDHALSLYENTYRYYKLGQTPWIKLDDFKKLMSIPEDVYSEFKYLNRAVIKKAIKEVSKSSNIELEVEFAKQGRNVTALRFFVSEKVKKDMFDPEIAEGTISPELESLLTSFGLNSSQVIQLFDRFDISYLAEKANWLERKFASHHSINNRAAYTWAAIMEDYQEQYVDNGNNPPAKSPPGEPGISKAGPGGFTVTYAQIEGKATEEQMAAFRKSFEDNLSRYSDGKGELAAMAKVGLWHVDPLKTTFARYCENYVLMRNNLAEQFK